jgi:hypothetical protein
MRIVSRHCPSEATSCWIETAEGVMRFGGPLLQPAKRIATANAASV